MNANIGSFSVTDLRHKTSEVLEQAESQGFVYVFRHSKPQAAVIELNYLLALQEAYEDYLDTLEFDRTINLKKVSFANHKKRTLKR